MSPIHMMVTDSQDRRSSLLNLRWHQPPSVLVMPVCKGQVAVQERDGASGLWGAQVCAMDTNEDWAEKKEQEKNERFSSLLGFINHPSHREESGWKASQTNFTTGVRGPLHTNQFLTRLESLGVKNKNTREAIRSRTVQKTLSMSDMILKFFFIALNSKSDCTLQILPTEIVNKNTERFNLHLQPPRP